MTDQETSRNDYAQNIESEREIERLIYRYGHVLDYDTTDAYADLFAEDGSIEIQSDFANKFGLETPPAYKEQGLAIGGILTEKGIIFSGRDTLKKFATPSGQKRRFLHVASQPLVTIIDADKAEALSYMRVYYQDFGDQPQLQGFGRYVDSFVRGGSRWLIQRRVCEV